MMRGALIATLLLLVALPIATAATGANVHGGSGVAGGNGIVTATGDRVSIFGSVEIAQNWHLTGDAVSIFGSVTVYGRVDGNAISIFGSVRVADGATVGGNAVAVFGRIRAEGSGLVMGSRTSLGLPGASLGLPGGSYHLLQPFSRLGLTERYPWHHYGGIAFSLLAAGLVAVLFPHGIARIKRGMEHRLALSAIAGLAAYAVVGLAIIFSVVTIIGIPLGATLAMGLLVARLLGHTALMLMVGERILGARSGEHQLLSAVLLGALVVGLVSAAPIVGMPVSMAVSLMALGGAILSRFGLGTAST